ncbi:MAG TPA: heavy-metal-associated domain-containing protein [Flavisolibacter sp.]|jgi:copper chaperone CopZ|nr:heavy-metal-associated domain-containing protein [Flavisolibacter sp.]
MKKSFLFISLILSIVSHAQVTKVHLQASGLTCSMCSNAINKALKSLDFIDQVEANVTDYTFELTFRPHADVDFDKIRKKVEGAGFFVSRFVATIHFDPVELKEKVPVTIGNYSLLFVNNKARSLNGLQEVTLLDKGFLTAQEYKRNALAPAAGVYHVRL